jgi:hypothetical protein
MRFRFLSCPHGSSVTVNFFYISKDKTLEKRPLGGQEKDIALISFIE